MRNTADLTRRDSDISLRSGCADSTSPQILARLACHFTEGNYSLRESPQYLFAISQREITVSAILRAPSRSVRPFFILRIVRPRTFESRFRNHCAKRLDGALRTSTSFM